MTEDKSEKVDGLAAYRAKVAQEKRGALMDAAIALFLEKGYGKTSLEEIARKAGVSSATLYKHFPTKDQLFGGVMERMWVADAGAPSTSFNQGTPESILREIGMSYSVLLMQNETVALFRLIVSEALHFPELGQELYMRGKKPYLERLHEYVAGACESGDLVVDDIPLATRQFLGMINDIVFWPRLLIVDLVISDAEAKDVVEGAVTVFLARYQP